MTLEKAFSLRLPSVSLAQHKRAWKWDKDRGEVRAVTRLTFEVQDLEDYALRELVLYVAAGHALHLHLEGPQIAWPMARFGPDTGDLLVDTKTTVGGG